MNLISIIIALVVEHFVTSLPELRRFEWFATYVNGFRSRLQASKLHDSTTGLLLVVFLPVCAVGLLDTMLGNAFAGLSFLFGLAVLIYCLGPGDLLFDLEQVLEAMRRRDYEAADIQAENLLGETVAEQPHPLAEKVKSAVFVQTNTRILGVLLWFVLLGPIGAVMFRLSCLLNKSYGQQDDDFAFASQRLFQIMFWLPVRVCILCFAVVGNFVDTMIEWRHISDFWKRDSEELLVISGLGAIRHEKLVVDSGDELDTDINVIMHCIELVKRAVIFWVVVLAVLTLAGWLI